MAKKLSAVEMSIKEFIRFSMTKDPRTAVLIGADHGVGKSSVIRALSLLKKAKISKALGKSVEYGFQDFRLSQNDVGDLKGIPFQVSGVTHFAPPSWYPIHEEDRASLNEVLKASGKELAEFVSEEHGIIFLDEMNRAQIDVQQVAFQLVLDREMNGTRIPDGWEIFAAINDDSNTYEVNAMDPALLDRFFYVRLAPTVKEWLEWAEGDGDIHPAVVSFIKATPAHLRVSSEELKQATREGAPTFSPRAWEMLSTNLKRFEEADEGLSKDIPYLSKVAGGFLGLAMGMEFSSFVKDNYMKLRPQDVIKSFTKPNQKHVRSMDANKATAFTDEVIAYLAKQEKAGKLTSKHEENLVEFFKVLADSKKKEVCGAAWVKLLGEVAPVATRIHGANRTFVLSLVANPAALK